MIDDNKNKKCSTSKHIEFENDNNGNKNECRTNMHNQQKYHQAFHQQHLIQERISSSAGSSSDVGGADIKLQLWNADNYLKQQQNERQQHQLEHHHHNNMMLGKQTEINRHVSEYKNFIDVGGERDSSAGYHTKNDSISLMSARSMPDLPKVCIYILWYLAL